MVTPEAGAAFDDASIIQMLTRGLDAGLCIITADFKTRWANEVIEEIFGEVEGKICYETYNKQPTVCSWCGAKRVFETGHGPVKTIAVGKDRDGAEIVSQIVAIPFERTNGRVTSVLELVLPITEHKQRERELERALNQLRESEERFRGAFEQAIVGMALVGIDGRFIETNDALDAMLGYERDELRGKSFRDVTLPEDLEDGDAFVRRAVAGELENTTFEKRYRRQNGDVISALVSSRILRGADGTPSHFVTHIQDITARRGLEKRLALAEKMEALGNLAGGIAHDFNNVLSAIIGNAELAELDAAEGSELRGQMRDVVAAAARARELVRKILTFSRQGQTDRRPVHVAAVIDEALQMLRASVPAAVEIRRRVTSDALVSADSTQLHQLILNLCTNAALAMEETGGVLQVELTDVLLDEDFAADHPETLAGPHLCLAVTDTGCGIPPEIKDRIFEPFFTTRPRDKGSGMGLAVVHSIVRDHRGALAVESEPGSGTRVEVHLPICPAPPVTEALPRGAPLAGSEHILFVDDEEMQVKTAQRLLERLGYRVTATTSSQEALEIFRSRANDFDLVITDVTMPGLPGDVLAERLLALRPDLPIILCTGFSGRIDESRVRELGIRSCLMKPVGFAELSEAIRQVLGE